MADSNKRLVDEVKFSSGEYFKSLEKWVQDVMLWQHFNYISFQSFMLNQAVTLRPTWPAQQPVNFRNYTAYQTHTQIRGKQIIYCKRVDRYSKCDR